LSAARVWKYCVSVGRVVSSVRRRRRVDETEHESEAASHTTTKH
jgi:hypothetical protein